MEGKDSLGESFVDAKDELISGTSVGTLNKDSLQVSPIGRSVLNMKLKGLL